MKTPSDELFTLIKSLSSQEKRYFKLYAQQSGKDADYLKLFDAINSLGQYNEKKVLAMLAKKGGIKNFSYLKNYLQEVIGRFLEHHYSDYSISIQLQRYLQRIEIFYGKNLFGLAMKIINKAEKIAIENDYYLYLLAIRDWKYRIAVSRRNLEELEKYENEGYASVLKYIDYYKNTVEYKKLNARQFHIVITQGMNPVKKNVHELNTLLQHPLLRNESRILSDPAKEMRYHILGEMCIALRDWRKCHHYMKQYIELLEQRPSYESDKLNSYMECISTIMVALAHLGKKDELLFIKNKAELFFKSLSVKLQSNNLYHIYTAMMHNYIYYLMESFDMKEALKCSEEIKTIVEKYGTVDSLIVLYGNFFMSYFYTEDYHKGLNYINKILILKNQEVREDIFNVMRMLNILVHYELGNEDMLSYLCRSTRNYLEKNRMLSKTETLLLDFFSKTIVKTNSRKEKIKAFTELKNELEILVSDASEKDIVYYFDFIAWSESKIENRPFVEIVRQKAKLPYGG